MKLPSNIIVTKNSEVVDECCEISYRCYKVINICYESSGDG
jgi:hypothetical protein